MYGGAWIPIVILGLVLIALTFIPVIGEIVGVVLLIGAVIVGYLWVKKNF